MSYAYQPVPRVSTAYDASPPPELLAQSKELFAGTLELMGGAHTAAPFARMVAAKYPVHAERARVAGAAVGIDPLDLLTAHLCYDALLGSSGMACSTMALAGEHGPVLARNMDWFPEAAVARASCMVSEPFGMNAGFVGMIGVVTGASRKGFVVALNAAFGGSDPTGYPMLLFLRHLVDTAADFGEAVAMAERERLAAGGIITIVGKRNGERAVVERTPTRAVVRVPKGDEPLIATNHHRQLARPEPCPRYEYLAAHAGKRPPLELLTSPQVRQSITAQHVVMSSVWSADMWVPSHLLAAGAESEYTLDELRGFFTG